MTEINFDVDTSRGYPVERSFDANGEVWLNGTSAIGWLLWVADNWDVAAEMDADNMPPVYCRAVAVGLRSAAKHLMTVFDPEPSEGEDVPPAPDNDDYQQPETD